MSETPLAAPHHLANVKTKAKTKQCARTAEDLKPHLALLFLYMRRGIIRQWAHYPWLSWSQYSFVIFYCRRTSTADETNGTGGACRTL